MSAACYKMTEMIPTTSVHLIDRSEDVIFELVWVIKRSILSFPVYITKKKVKSVIDSAVLHWTTWLMVFPRNAGFGRCYLVSTRHEILSNIDRNLTGTRLRLRKNRNKINPARVRIPSQFHCCHLSLNCSALLSVVRISKTTLPSLTPEGGGGGGWRRRRTPHTERDGDARRLA